MTFRTGRSSRRKQRRIDRAYEKPNQRRDFMSPSNLAGTAIPGRGTESAHAPLLRRDWTGGSTRDQPIRQARNQSFPHRLPDAPPLFSMRLPRNQSGVAPAELERPVPLENSHAEADLPELARQFRSRDQSLPVNFMVATIEIAESAKTGDPLGQDRCRGSSSLVTSTAQSIPST